MKKSWNRILDNTDREEYQPLIEKMFSALPDMMARKIGTANVQQAFTVEAVTALTEGKDILCVGSFEDTACEYLRIQGMNVEGIDPVLNTSLHEFQATELYDTIFACSVIEHTTDDMQFMAEIIQLLRPGGVGILTCDFKNDWKAGQRVPYTSNRFYTEKDLLGRFKDLLESSGCKYIDTPQWSNQKYEFAWEGIPYDFATLVFRKDADDYTRNTNPE